MARQKKIELSALNIRLTTDSHKPEDYISLFNDLKRLELSGRIGSKEWGQILQFHEESDYVNDWCYYGDILRFTAIEGWYDSRKNEEVSDNDLTDISIPDHFKANGQRLSFIFFPENHIFVFQTYSGKRRLGPTSCERMMQTMLESPAIVDKYGDIEVTLIPDRDELESAFNIPRLETISLMINRPNPDSFAKTEQVILDRMHALNVRSVERSYKSVKDESIEADDELKNEAGVAARNGRVYIKGKDDSGLKKEFHTEEHPLREQTFYDEEVELETQAFSNYAKSIKDKIIEWVNNVANP